MKTVQYTDIANESVRLSVCLSVCDTSVLHQYGRT